MRDFGEVWLYVKKQLWLSGSAWTSKNAGWPKKVSHYQIIKTLCFIVLKSAMRLDFFVKLKK